jgi:hypothetical protein
MRLHFNFFNLTTAIFAAAATSWDLNQAAAAATRIAQHKTKFLAMIGGLDASGWREVFAHLFAMGTDMIIADGQQQPISELASTQAGTPSVNVPTPNKNHTQIDRKNVEVSQISQALNAVLGSSVTNLTVDPGNSTPNVSAKFETQTEVKLQELWQDLEFSMLNGGVGGAYVEATGPSVVGKMLGVAPAITTTAYNAGGSPLSETILKDNLLLPYSTQKLAQRQGPVIVGRTKYTSVVSDIYEIAPESRNVGGVNIRQIITPYGTYGIQDVEQAPDNTLLILDLPYIHPVYVPVETGQIVSMKELSTSGASEAMQIMTVASIDFGAQSLHAKAYNLA